MGTRKLAWALTASCLALLTLGTPAGRPQPGRTPIDQRDPDRSVTPAPSTPFIPPPDLPTVPGTQAPPAPSAPVTKPAPPPPTVEELLGELEKLRKEKADLEKQEQALVAKLRERLKDQQDRLRKVGLAPAPPATSPKDAVDYVAPPLLKAK